MAVEKEEEVVEVEVAIKVKTALPLVRNVPVVDVPWTLLIVQVAPVFPRLNRPIHLAVRRIVGEESVGQQ